jgi:glycosyltransferase involved in cell wall biosynthesis
MYDCLWYGGGRLRRAWVRFCLRTVDRCIVWGSVECKRYSHAYGVPREKFLYVPHHHTLHHFKVKVGDQGFVFTGGNADRDYGLFLDAVRELDVPCILATNRSDLLDGLNVPPNVQVRSLSTSEFRQRMAEARIVVMPMRATLLHAGAQQSILNAMLLGKPVVLTDPEGGSDYIENGRSGMLVHYGDVGALRQAIRFLLDHPDEARAMGERARLTAAPLTTQHCNELIWAAALRLAEDRGRTAVRFTHTPSEVGKAEEDSLGKQV